MNVPSTADGAAKFPQCALTARLRAAILRPCMDLKLTRMSAAGNVFYVGLDLSLSRESAPRLARAVCAGWGANLPSDGLILAASSPPVQHMLNPDGSEGLCANGLRCLALLLADGGLLARPTEIATCAGPRRVGLSPDGPYVQLGEAADLPGRPGSVREAFSVRVLGERLTGFGVELGNPHFVVFCDDGLRSRIGEFGPALQEHGEFPGGINVEFATREGDSLRVRVWERGAGETLSCGTGAAAVASAGPEALRRGHSVRLLYPGGTLTVAAMEHGGLTLSGQVVNEGIALYPAAETDLEIARGAQ